MNQHCWHIGMSLSTSWVTLAPVPINETEHADTIDTLFGTEPLIAPELTDMISTNGPPVQAKPCNVHSLGMTLAMTMMEYGAFTDIGDHGLMQLLMVYCGQGSYVSQKAVQMVQNQLFRTRKTQYPTERVTQTIQKLLDAPAVAQLIHMIEQIFS